MLLDFSDQMGTGMFNVVPFLSCSLFSCSLAPNFLSKTQKLALREQSRHSNFCGQSGLSDPGIHGGQNSHCGQSRLSELLVVLIGKSLLLPSQSFHIVTEKTLENRYFCVLKSPYLSISFMWHQCLLCNTSHS
jgi:hypothetical protein